MEVILTLSNYGNDYTTFIKISDKFEDLLFINPKLPHKYFSRSVAIPSVIPDGFDKDKKDNSFRIFVFGGSTTVGYPYPTNASFSRQLRRKLELLYPDVKFEVVNLGTAAVNSIFARELINDVLEQEPDLILIYMGHNEYFGVYGAASGDFYSGNYSLINIINKLKNLKIYQLFTDVVYRISELFPGERLSNQTLMAIMAQKNLVPKNSNIFINGLNLFEKNMDYILSACRNYRIPVFTGTLTSNLLQKPLDVIVKEKSTAEEYYNRAMIDRQRGDRATSWKLLEQAKEYDELRFRAPKEMNGIIKSLSKKYNFPVVNIDSVFSLNEGNALIKSGLFVDHLHPNIRGYKLIADSYYEKIREMDLLRDFKKRADIDTTIVDRILIVTQPFTGLDSSFSDIKIEILLNSYPFVLNPDSRKILSSIELKDLNDSLAMQAVLNKKSWDDVHIELAEIKLRRKDYWGFFRELFTVIEDKPFYKYTYDLAVQKLMEAKKYHIAKIVLNKQKIYHPDKFLYKNLGICALETGDIKNAINKFEKSNRLFPNDPEINFRLSNAYFISGDVESAMEAIDRCLFLKLDYPNAKNVKESLTRLLSE
ncbi:GDSL-type esterase/lipase family protein [Bacteroidota bacterium]